MCAKSSAKVHATFQLCVQNYLQKLKQNFQLSLQNSAKFHTNVHLIVQKLCKTTHKFPIVCAIGCPESFSEHLVKFFFLQFFLRKRKQEQQSYGGGDVCGGRIVFSKSFLNLFVSKISKTLCPSSFKLERSMHQARTPCKFYLVS